jgi:hypothetical protein
LLSSASPSASCPLTSSGITICDSSHSNCARCNSQTTTAAGILFTCSPINFNGAQVITASYSYGPLSGTIANSASFSGCAPAAPVTPPVTPPIVAPVAPPTCTAGSVDFAVGGPFLCRVPFQVRLVALSPTTCPVVLAAAQVCSPIGVCLPCAASPQAPGGWLFNCPPQALAGPVILNVDFRFATGAILRLSRPSNIICPL